MQPTVNVAFWSKTGGQPVKVTFKDENGSVWQELTATSRQGYNAIDYDLGADPAKADAAEAVARAKALEKKKEAKEKAERPSAGEKPPSADEAEDEEEEEAASKPAAGAPSVLDDALQAALADPLRATRKRYLPAGRYTVEITAGPESAKTRLTVKPPREQPRVDDDAAETGR